MNSKHLATFLMGAAAGAALLKYNTMTPEEKEKVIADLKDQANKMKTEAEGVVSNLQTYWEEVSNKGMDALKNYATDAQKTASDMMNPTTNSSSNTKA